jgi:hypothetical protein
VGAVDRAANVARALDLGGPALVSAMLEGIDDVPILRSRPRCGGRRISKPSGFLGFAQINDLQAPTADHLHEMMEKMWLIGGWDDGSPFIAEGHWTGYGAP